MALFSPQTPCPFLSRAARTLIIEFRRSAGRGMNTLPGAASLAAASDVLPSSSTVRAALMVGALLTLPRSMPCSQKVERVDAIIKELVRRNGWWLTVWVGGFETAGGRGADDEQQGWWVVLLWAGMNRPALTSSPAQDLEGCQHTLIRGEALHMNGTSGGQRRRLSGIRQVPPGLCASRMLWGMYGVRCGTGWRH